MQQSRRFNMRCQFKRPLRAVITRFHGDRIIIHSGQIRRIVFLKPAQNLLWRRRQKIRRRAASQRRERRKEQGEKVQGNAAWLIPNWPETGPAHREIGRQKSAGKGFHQLPLSRQSGCRAAAQTGQPAKYRHHALLDQINARTGRLAAPQKGAIGLNTTVQ